MASRKEVLDKSGHSNHHKMASQHQQLSQRRIRRSNSTGSRGSRDGGDIRLIKLQTELNEVTVKHREELYWLKLELDTTRREKEAVEDRMAELYRDMQELQEDTRRSPVKSPPVDATYVNDLQNQLKKYERMVRVMHNQINLVRNSTDNVVKSLKDEISDLMDDKSRNEVSLMNKLSDLEKQNKELAFKLEVAEQQQKPTVIRLPPSAAPAPPPPRRLVTASIRSNGHESATNLEQKEAELKRLRAENRKVIGELNEERKNAKKAADQALEEKEKLTQKVDSLENELLVVRSSADVVNTLERLQQDRTESLTTLERVALVWDRADESIHNLEHVMAELRPTDERMSEGQERMLSTLETAALVHGQIKVSLMLIELKLRNNLSCLGNDRATLGGIAADDVFEERLTAIQKESMDAIEQVGGLLNEQIARLEEQSVIESKFVKDELDAKVGDIRRMENIQKQLEEEITKLHDSTRSYTKEELSGDDNAELFVSRKVLEQLQLEVLQVVERVKEKNEQIGRLTAIVEEHKVRERSLMQELKRMLAEQAKTEMEERQRRFDAQAAEDDESDVTDSDYEDNSSSAPYYGEDAPIRTESREEETFLEESVMEETVYEEEIVEEVAVEEVEDDD